MTAPATEANGPSGQIVRRGYHQRLTDKAAAGCDFDVADDGRYEVYSRLPDRGDLSWEIVVADRRNLRALFEFLLGARRT